MAKVMRGLLKEAAAPGKFVYHDDLPVPEISDDEILIKVHCSAVCGSDMHIMEWDDWSKIYVTPPVIPGHMVTVKKMTEELNRDYFITQVVHHVDKDGFQTTIRFAGNKA